ncbi:heavy metal-responsive transcriptional regulator [Kordiimonas aquimaris]|uniref:heavy metal-responsive transcriptional regulator n=1 Tax=Kordiimonas aquimaris TaxID=707591 RepID=UPI0021D2A7FF|nr:heavy metal-responsive transcriptional regulator [Kordiimonas aquimaris]
MTVQLTIGKLADATGVSVETIRYYERRGILPKPGRLSSGYRVYGQESLLQLKFIKNAQTLGFTLRETKELLSITEDPDADCARINETAQAKLKQINEKLKLLRKIKRNLTVLAEYCPADDQPLSECSIINHLYGEREM